MQRSDVAIATLTLVRDPEEHRLVAAALSGLAAAGMPVAISDGGSPPDFLDYVAGLPAVQAVPPDHPGLVGQIKASLRAAAQTGRRFILYLEPDKESFVESRLASFLSQAPDDNDVGVVLAARSARSLDTYPSTQKFAESAFNTLAGEALRLPADYLYGPCVLNRELVPSAEGAGAALGWGWRPYVFAIALRVGLRILAIEGEHPCPDAQRAERDADRIHRLRQLGQNLNGLVEGLTARIPGDRFPSGAGGV